MPETIIIYPVDWCCNDAPDDPGGGYPYYRACDICFCSASDDAIAGLPIDQFRGFWYDSAEGLSVCERCIDGYLGEKPEEHHA